MECFDPDQNTRFSTYASWWIKQAIKRSLINTDKPIHIPAYMVKMITRYRAARDQFFEAEGRPPNVQELADKLQMTVGKVGHIHDAVKAVSTPSHDSDGIDGQALTEGIADSRTPGPDEVLMNEGEASRMVAVLDDLDTRESTILRLRYGLDGKDPMTLKEIGTAVRLTRERVRQIECEALQKIKQHLDA